MAMTARAALLGVLVALAIAAPKLWALAFSQARIIIEVNATDGDAGVQIFVDAAGWDTLEVFDPRGEKVFEVRGTGSVGEQGVTELFFESEEPSLEDVPLSELFERFPEGDYTFLGKTADGKPLSGKARLTHSIPAGPEVVAPAAGAVLPAQVPVMIDWSPVTTPFPGANPAASVVAYEVIVERLKARPAQVFSVTVPAAVTHVTVSPEFLQGKSEYKFEVLAIEAGGNQTITESSFKTQ
jgi:hypothetical protein